jgi:hypothetical protein
LRWVSEMVVVFILGVIRPLFYQHNCLDANTISPAAQPDDRHIHFYLPSNWKNTSAQAKLMPDP